ncbi:MAG: hypothetical protein HUJ75_07495 [Parasporobacterium sp.]|nr:hypothetical protein [Parasporobacterium sp.]
MQSATKMYIKKLAKSLIAALIGMGVSAFFIALAAKWQITDWARFLSDAAIFPALVFLIVFTVMLLKKHGSFDTFNYTNITRKAKEKGEIPPYSSFTEYLEKKPKPTFPLSLLWIPLLVLFAVSIIFAFVPFGK